MWELNAKRVEKEFGGFVDWDERFYNCPECGEPIYDCDWNDDELRPSLCPVCEFDIEEDEEELNDGYWYAWDEDEEFYNA